MIKIKEPFPISGLEASPWNMAWARNATAYCNKLGTREALDLGGLVQKCKYWNRNGHGECTATAELMPSHWTLSTLPCTLSTVPSFIAVNAMLCATTNLSPLAHTKDTCERIEAKKWKGERGKGRTTKWRDLRSQLITPFQWWCSWLNSKAFLVFSYPVSLHRFSNLAFGTLGFLSVISLFYKTQCYKSLLTVVASSIVLLQIPNSVHMGRVESG